MGEGLLNLVTCARLNIMKHAQQPLVHVTKVLASFYICVLLFFKVPTSDRKQHKY